MENVYQRYCLNCGLPLIPGHDDKDYCSEACIMQVYVKEVRRFISVIKEAA